MQRIRFVVSAFFAATVYLAGTPVSAAPLDLSKPPLFLNASVDPNLMVTFDDSGSMGQGYTPDDVEDLTCEWRHRGFFSSALNKQYYDPAITYTPPLRADGTRFPDSSFASARIDGFDTASATVNLGTAYFVSIDEPGSRITYEAGRNYNPAGCGSDRVFAFPTGSASAFYCTLGADLDGDGDASATDDGNYTCTTAGVPASEQTNFANWFTYYRIRGLALKSAVARSFGVLDDDVRVAIQNMNNRRIAAGTTIGRFTGTRRTDFFDRLFSSPYSGNTPALSAAIRAGRFFERSGSAETNPYWDQATNRELSCRQNFHVMVSDGYWNHSTNDDPHPVETAIQNASITSRTLPDGRSFTNGDAYSRFIWAEGGYVDESTNPDSWVASGRSANCNFAGGQGACTPSYSDIAMYFWARDLRTDASMTNNVPTYLPDRRTGVTGPATDLSTVTNLLANDEVYWNPANDPATWQHVVQFFVGFGISGRIPNSADTLTKLRRGENFAVPLPASVTGGPVSMSRWTGARNLSPESVDDSWRATLASRGAFFGATDPNAIVDALTDILSSIVARRGTAAAVSVSTGIIRSGSLAYQTSFDPTDWSGTVLARPVAADFTFGAPTWDAGCLLTGGDCATTNQTGLPGVNWDTGRKILTSTAAGGPGNGAAFRWGNLTTAQQNALNDNPATVAVDNDGLGADRLKYLRGDRSNERRAGAGKPFRNRNSVFGAVVHSGAIVVGPPAAETYDDTKWPTGSDEANATTKYRDFAATHASRRSVVYVGANDGMLHALDAATGNELWAYVPWAAYRNLSKLTNPTYSYEPYVDNSVTVRDVYTGGRWRSLLVGSLRRGGQGIFALDVTTPNLTEGDTSAVLWEFNDTASGGANLGYTYGTPFITRLRNGKWVVLLPAGYNSDEADGTVGNGKAVLFVLDAANGSVLKEFNLGAVDGNATGLAAPIAVDLDHDDITEMAYAGDLAGNLWRFDLTAASANSWTASRLLQPATNYARPITAQPRAERNPDTGTPMVFVGTGKYIERGDRTTAIPTQAFYGLYDEGATIAPSQLSVRSVTTDAGGLRRVSALTPPASGAPRGWAIEFAEAAYPGERVVTAASIRIVGRRVIFSTLIPAGDDPCLPGGRSFVMFADFATGGTSVDNYAFFDTNANNRIDASDDATAVGKLVGTLVPGVAAVLPPGGGTGAIVLPGDTPQTIRTREFMWRRRSWREQLLP